MTEPTERVVQLNRGVEQPVDAGHAREGRLTHGASASSALQSSWPNPSTDSGWMHTWSTPASWCAWTRLRTVSASPTRDERVDEPWVPLLDLVVGEAESQPVVAVVRQTRVHADRSARRGTCGRRVGREHDLLLDAEQLVGPEDRSGFRGVLGRRPVGMRAVRVRARELEHLRPERGEQRRWLFRRRRSAIRRRAHRFEVRAHLRERLRIVELSHSGDHGGVAHAEAQHEAVAGLLGERQRGLLHRPGMTVEDAGDPGGERQSRSLRGEVRDVRHRISTDGVWQPQGRVAQRLDPRRELAGRLDRHPVGEVPDARCLQSISDAHGSAF